MKTSQFVVFLTIVLSLYSLINYYIFNKGLALFPPGSSFRKYFIVVFILLALAFIAGRVLERFSVSAFSTALIWAGSFWLAVMTYLFLLILAIDILRLFNSIIPFFPEFIYANPVKTKNIIAIIVVGITLLTVTLGHINTRYPVVKRMDIDINKSAGKIKSLRAAVISDVHLGTILGRSFLEKVVHKINELQPDIILIPGDILDEDLAPVLHYNIGEVLVKLNAKYGVYAVTGNHEYIGGVDKAREYLTAHNIKILSDEAVLIDSSFYLVGREDLSIKQFLGRTRKPLSEILTNVDSAFPLILLDHQPFKLEEAENNRIDLQLSGHTHHGQMFPFNFITKMVYELSWGYLKKGNTQYYVSCGVGGWGPPVRTGSRPEILMFNLRFD